MAEGPPLGPIPERDELLNQERDLWARILALQERFGYLFLAFSGSAIAFAVAQTKDELLAVWMLPMGVAVLIWALSFLLSAMHVQLRTSILLGELKSIQIHLGRDSRLVADMVLANEALARLDRDKRRRDKRSGTCGRWAFYLFLAGTLFFIVGHIQRLIMSSPGRAH